MRQPKTSFTLAARYAVSEAPAVSAALRWTITLAAPLLLTLAFPKIALGAVALVALAPLFWLWSKSSWTQAARDGWVSGTLFFFAMFFWMTNSLGDFIGNWKLLAGFMLAAIEALAFAASAALTALICRRGYGALAVFAVPSAWLLTESVRTRGSLGVPFAELGLTAVHIPPLLPLAAFVGAYGLTAAIALFNAALVGIASGNSRGRSAGIVAIVALVVLTAAGDAVRARVAVPPAATRVAIAQGDISQREKWSPEIFAQTLSVYSDLTRRAARGRSQLVIWPETAVTSYPLQDPALLAYLGRLASANRIWLMTGTVDRPSPTTWYNTVILLSPQGRLSGRYDKHILVPFAEYLPLNRYFRGLPLFDEASQFVPGPGPGILHAAGMHFGMLICYESAFAPYAREIANAGAGALVIVTDDAWFGHTSGPYQHADMAIVDAVETGRWVIRGADTGISEIIDPKGHVVARLDLDEAGMISADVGPPLATPYVRYGVWWLLLAALVSVVAGLVHQRDRAAGWRSRRGRR